MMVWLKMASEIHSRSDGNEERRCSGQSSSRFLVPQEGILGMSTNSAERVVCESRVSQDHGLS